MASTLEAKPTSDNTAPNVSVTGERPAGSEKIRRNVKGGVCPVQWATRAWMAVERALARCPYPLGCVDESSPDHGLWVADREEFIALYSKRLIAGTAIKWLKFHTTYCFGYACNQSELPAAPGPMEPFEKAGRFVGRTLGKALQCVMARGRAGNWPCRRCAYDVLMSKLGDPPATDEFVAGALEDHKKALTSERPELDPAGQARRSQVEEKLWGICQTVFAGKVLSHRDLLPSLRASIYGRMAQGGALGELLRDFGYEQDGPRSPELVAMVFDPRQGVSELRLPYVDDIVCDFQDYVDLEWLGRSDERLEAQPCPILEPLKVRTITKGQAAEYYRCLELQKMMHSTLRNHPVFGYIGHPIDNAEFGACFGCAQDLLPDQFYVSGDYKAATDNLDPSLSEFAWGCIAATVRCDWEGKLVPLLETPYYELGTKALTGHRLHYPKKLSRKEKDKIDDDLLEGRITEEQANALLWDLLPQKWGQLMGSPMSFPILCLVNAAATLVALDLPLARDTKLRVNGDDIAFITNAEGYARWKKITAECGLEFSLGKNYTSREFLIMNSELRRPPSQRWEAYKSQTGYLLEVKELGLSCRTRLEWIPEEETLVRPASWKLEGFVNQSLLYHTVRKGMDAGKEKDVYWTDLADLSVQILAGIPDGDQMKVMNLFLHAHDSVLREIPPLANLWVPKELGGVGLCVPAGQTREYLARHGRKADLVLKQQKLAAYMACNPGRRLKHPTTPKSSVGTIDEGFRELRELSDRQVPPLLRKNESGMFPGQKPLLEGTELLGLTLMRMTGPLVEMGDALPPVDLNPEQLTARHRTLNALLNQRYRNWTRKGLEHSLTEMGFDTMSDYVEKYHLVSYVECLRSKRIGRSIDRPLLVVVGLI